MAKGGASSMVRSGRGLGMRGDETMHAARPPFPTYDHGNADIMDSYTLVPPHPDTAPHNTDRAEFRPNPSLPPLPPDFSLHGPPSKASQSGITGLGADSLVSSLRRSLSLSNTSSPSHPTIPRASLPIASKIVPESALPQQHPSPPQFPPPSSPRSISSDPLPVSPTQRLPHHVTSPRSYSVSAPPSPSPYTRRSSQARPSSHMQPTHTAPLPPFSLTHNQPAYRQHHQHSGPSHTPRYSHTPNSPYHSGMASYRSHPLPKQHQPQYPHPHPPTHQPHYPQHHPRPHRGSTASGGVSGGGLRVRFEEGDVTPSHRDAVQDFDLSDEDEWAMVLSSPSTTSSSSLSSRSVSNTTTVGAHQHQSQSQQQKLFGEATSSTARSLESLASRASRMFSGR